MIHTNIRARKESRIELQFYHNQIEYAEKCYLSSLTPQRWTKISTEFCFTEVNEIEQAIVSNIQYYILTCDYVICLRATLPDSIFPL